MEGHAAIAVVGTFDSKGEEHLFLKERIEGRGGRVLTVNVGTGSAPPFEPDFDLFAEVIEGGGREMGDRDLAIQTVINRGRELLGELHGAGKICGMIWRYGRGRT